MNERDQIKQYGQLIAKAWSEPAFMERLSADSAATLREQGFAVPDGVQMRVLEPTGPRLYLPLPAETLAGEYPSELVDLWRRAQTEPAFKARLLAEPAVALAEQGLEAPAGVPIEVVEVSDTQGYIAVPPAPESLDADAAEDVAGYFSCCGPPPSEAVPRKVEGQSYGGMWATGTPLVTPWAPTWMAPQGTAAVNRPLTSS